MEVPFSNMTQQPVEMQKTLQTKKVNISMCSEDLKLCIYKQLNGDIGPVGHFHYILKKLNPELTFKRVLK